MRVLAATPVRPNHITAARILTAFGAAAAFADGSHDGLWIGSGLFVLSALLDRADGELARSTQQTSPAGHRLDLLSDFISNAVIFVGMGIGARHGWLQAWAPSLGLLAAISVAVVVWRLNRSGEAISATHRRRLLDPDDMMMGVPLLACTVGPVPVLLLAGTITPLAAVWLLMPERAFEWGVEGRTAFLKKRSKKLS